MLDNKFFKFAAAFMVVISLFFMVKQSKDFSKSLKQNTFLSTGRIVDRVPHNSKNSTGVSFWYVYAFKNKTYKQASFSYAYTNGVDHTSQFINKTFPVVIDSTNPAISDILLSESRFKAFDISFPDSLTWVKDYLR